MNKCGSDPKVKKTLIRNYESKVKPSRKQAVAHDVACSSKESFRYSHNENELSQPSLCSSEALANYLADVKKALPTPLSEENPNIDKVPQSSKLTKKLNFHFNDRIYKNLIELNANVDDLKNKKVRRTPSTSSVKRDLEPNIEDFYEDEKEYDVAPTIPIIKPKFKPVRKVDSGQLHKMVAFLEDL